VDAALPRLPPESWSGGVSTTLAAFAEHDRRRVDAVAIHHPAAIHHAATVARSEVARAVRKRGDKGDHVVDLGVAQPVLERRHGWLGAAALAEGHLDTLAGEAVDGAPQRRVHAHHPRRIVAVAHGAVRREDLLAGGYGLRISGLRAGRPSPANRRTRLRARRRHL